MKKLVFMFVAVAAIETPAAADTVAADTVATDSVK